MGMVIIELCVKMFKMWFITWLDEHIWLNQASLKCYVECVDICIVEILIELFLPPQLNKDHVTQYPLLIYT